MTARTHDLGAFTALTLTLSFAPVPIMTFPTLITAFFANMLGGLFPDLDEPTARFWRLLRGGSLLGRIIKPLIGGHRLISHSLIGMVIIGFLTQKFFTTMSSVVLVDMHFVWLSFMLGVISHLVLDTFTHEGVPWFFPLPWSVGIPPFRFLRIKTGGIVEKSFVFPILVLLNFYLLFTYKDHFFYLFTHLVT